MVRQSFRPGILAALCVVLAPCVRPAPALAQSSAVRAENAEVEKLLARAIALRAEAKDLEAREVLEKAAEIDPASVRVQVHLGTVYQALGEWLLADEYLRLALRQENHPYIVRHRKSLEDAQAVIGANLGRLEVEGEPAGAEVRLNGRLVGTLPLAEPVRATVGSYSLEVRLAGHYTTKRPIVISSRGLVRESVRLEPLPPEEADAKAVSRPAQPRAEVVADRPAQRRWLTWTLGGLGVASGLTAIGAVVFREVHAAHWNDDARCLSVERTREQLCEAERDKVEAGDSVAIVTGVASGLFVAGALLNEFAFAEVPAPGRADVGCRLGLTGASCFGSF